MSQSRCGLQINRDITITNDHHNHPRKKQLGCLINGSIQKPGESMLTTDVAEDELNNRRVTLKKEKMDIAELSLGKLTAGVKALLPREEQKDTKLIERLIEEGLGDGLNLKQATDKAKTVLKIMTKGEKAAFADFVKEEMEEEKKEMKGKGIGSTLLKLVNILPLKKIGESVAATISNVFPDSDENARNIFPGEHHAVVKLPNNKFGRANYTGPGTRIIERLQREPGGDPPRVLSDKVSQAHDIRYGLAEGEDDIRKADLKMLSSLSDLRREKKDRDVNIIPAMIGIRGKVVAENFGLLSRSAFIDPKFKPSARDKQLMRSKLKELEQQGFGRIAIDPRKTPIFRTLIQLGEGFRDKPFKARKPGKFSPEVIRAIQAAPLARARVPFTSTIGKRNQVIPIGTLIKSVPKAVAKFKGPRFLDPQPGTSSTQSLVGIYGSDGRRGVALDRRGNVSSLSDRLKPQLNTRAEFRNRRSGVSQTGSGMHGGYQVPGMPSSTGHEMIDIKTAKKDITRTEREKRRKKPMEGGKGNPGVSPIQVQTGSGHRAPRLPGRALIAKMSKKVQKRKAIRGGRRKRPIFADEHEMSKIMAEQLLPAILAR